MNGTTKSEKIETVPGCYESFYHGMYRAITDNAPVQVSADEAMNTIKVIEFAIRSSREKKTIPFE